MWQAFAAVAGRLMDGGALYRAARRPAGTPHDGVAGIDDGDKPALDEQRGIRFVRWFERLFLQPPAAEDAWDPAPPRVPVRLLGPRAATGEGEKVYAAEEYHGGHLDW